jgi:hypothetical protein
MLLCDYSWPKVAAVRFPFQKAAVYRVQHLKNQNPIKLMQNVTYKINKYIKKQSSTYISNFHPAYLRASGNTYSLAILFNHRVDYHEHGKKYYIFCSMKHPVTCAIPFEQ